MYHILLLVLVERVLTHAARIACATDRIVHIDGVSATNIIAPLNAPAMLRVANDIRRTATRVRGVVRVTPRVLGQVFGEVGPTDGASKA